MRDYAKLSKALRMCKMSIPCTECPFYSNGDSHSKECGTMNDAAADAIEELLDELTTIRKQLPHWISVEERLPEVDERVLACAGIPGDLIVYDGARWNGEEWEAEAEAVYDYWTTIDDPVTHWMPLPEPPKGVE